MDNNSYFDTANKKIASFDRTYSNDHIRMLKILLHYIPASFRKNLSIYIKFMELQQALTSPLSFPELSSEAFVSETETIHTATYDTVDITKADKSKLIRELLPFCTPKEKQQFQNMEKILNQFEQMKNMLEMMEMIKEMKEMFGDSEEGNGSFDPSMLAGMIGGMNGGGFDPGMLAGMMGGMNGEGFDPDP